MTGHGKQLSQSRSIKDLFTVYNFSYHWMHFFFLFSLDKSPPCDLLATVKSRYFAQPRPIIVNSLHYKIIWYVNKFRAILCPKLFRIYVGLHCNANLRKFNQEKGYLVYY